LGSAGDELFCNPKDNNEDNEWYKEQEKQRFAHPRMNSQNVRPPKQKRCDDE